MPVLPPNAALLDLPKADLSHLPGRRGLPMLGQTLQFLRDPYGTYFQYQKTYGPVSRIGVFGQDWALLGGPEASEFVFMDRDKLFSAQNGLTPFAAMFSGGLLHRDFDAHRAHRRVMQSAFRAEALRGYHALMVPQIARQLGNWPNNQRFRIAPAFKDMTLRLAAHVFMGLTEASEIERMNANFIAEVAATAALIRWPLPFTAMRRGVKARADLADFFHAEISKRRVASRADFFSQLCQARDEDGNSWSDRDIVDHFNFLLVAAHDAVTGTLTAMTWALAKDPELQTALRVEVNGVSTDTLEYEGLTALPQLDAVYHEAMRRFAPSGFTARAVVRDTGWQGHALPAGTKVVVAPGPVMMDPDIYSAPERFDHNRFLNADATALHRFAYAPFGGGAHKCIGLHFAGFQVKAIMAALLQRFEIHLAQPDDPHWTLIPTPMPTNGLPVTLRPI